MANVKYFSGDVQLRSMGPMDNAEFARRFPGVKGRRYDSFSMWVGVPKDAGDAVYNRATQRWDHDFRAVDRVITYKSNPSRHECDARCMNATGRTMNCECSCGGKNHGRGSLACAAVAA